MDVPFTMTFPWLSMAVKKLKSWLLLCSAMLSPSYTKP